MILKLVNTFFLFLLLGICDSANAQVSANFNANLLAATAETATVNTADQINNSWKGGHFIFNASAYTSGTFTPHIQGKDPVSGTYYDICLGAAISSTGITVVKVYPGIATAVTGACSDILPRIWRISVVGASTPVATLSIGYFGEY